MKVADICTQEVVSTERTSTLQQAATLMRERHVGALVVIDDASPAAQVVGMVTDRDLAIEAVARGLDVTQIEIGRLASGKLAAIPAGASIDDAIAAMKKWGVRRLLVAGEGGQLSGIVSMDDLLDALAHEMSQMAHAARGGIEREIAERSALPAARPLTARIPEYSFE